MRYEVAALLASVLLLAASAHAHDVQRPVYGFHLAVDTTGDGLADSEKEFWTMPAGVSFDEALRAAGDELRVTGFNKWLVGGAPVQQAAPQACCAIM